MYNIRTGLLSSTIVLLLSLFTLNAYGSQSSDNDAPQVTWKNFTDRNNLFSAQYPSNWIPSIIPDPDDFSNFDTAFTLYGANEDSYAWVEFIQWTAPSAFSTSRDSLESEVSRIQSDPTVNKFEIERPIECSNYEINGIQACSIIYEISNDVGSFATLIVGTVAPDGTEYSTYYKGSFDFFERFLPVAENMIKSFRTTSTGSSGSDSDFSLSSNYKNTNTSNFQGTNETGGFVNSSSNDNSSFSFG